jgi:hypothetical protein
MLIASRFITSGEPLMRSSGVVGQRSCYVQKNSIDFRLNVTVVGIAVDVHKLI